MENKELDRTITQLKDALECLGDINMFCSASVKNIYQKRLQKTYDILFGLKKHLEFLKKVREKKNGKI